jgi:hypothetical protein
MNAVITWIKGNWFTIILAVLLVVAACGLLSFGFKLSAAESLNRKLVELNRSASIDNIKLDTDNKQLADDNRRSQQLVEQLKQNNILTSRNNIELTKQINAIRTNLAEAIRIINGQK